jgi:single-stranded DNA-binding protein
MTTTTERKPKSNFVEVTGNLGTDPELKFSGIKQTPITEVNIAVYSGKDRDDSWMTVKAFNHVAEAIAGGFRKGDKLWIKEGSLQQERWQDAEGNPRSRVVILAWKIGRIERPEATAPGPEATAPATEPEVTATATAPDYADIPF